MTEESQKIYPLPYAGPATRAPSATGFIVLVTVNALAAVASLWFVPLAVHIYSCTEGQKWCHMLAFVFGVPSAVVWVVLLAATASMTLKPQAIGQRSKPLKIAAWLFLSFAALVLVALFGAVVHNSK